MRNRDRAILADLDIFVTILAHGSMKRAALDLGVSVSALSHRMRKLEDHLGVRLLNRTSRSLAATVAGEGLAKQLTAGFNTIDEALTSLARQRENPAGRLRINVLQDAVPLLVTPILARYAAAFPDVKLEIHADDLMVDVVAGGFDAGIRYGDRVPLDMVGVALSAPTRWVVVGSDALIEAVGVPSAPKDLLGLPCIEIALGDGNSYSWELGNEPALTRLAVRGPVRANGTAQIIAMALEGVGFAYVLETAVRRELEDGRLRVVLGEWASDGPPFTVYYPSRRQTPPGLRELINLIRKSQGLNALNS
jgi:DNA-binding transcriptional LysR family regulator